MNRASRPALVGLLLSICLFATTAFALKAGERMPEIGIKDINGKTVDRASLAGKVVIVDFWASWCGPCKQEFPVLDKLQKKYGKDGLVVVGVSVDNELDNVKEFLGKVPASFTIAHDGTHAVTQRYSPPKMPSSYIVDRKGMIRFVHEGFNLEKDAPEMEKQVKELLAQ